MSLPELSRINLNLLVCLQTLLETCSVTQTASQLSLSQSAVSKSLARLRQVCGDPLFTRTAHGLIPTPRALTMQEQLRPLLDGMWHIIQPQSFVPAECQRHFRIALPESVTQQFLQQSLNRLLTEAPGLTLSLKGIAVSDIQQLATGSVDLLALPDDLDCGQSRIAGLHRQTLNANKLVCLLRHDHPCLARTWNRKLWLSLNHIAMEAVAATESVVDKTLRLQGVQRRFSVAVADFHTATGVCENSDLALVCTQTWADYAMSHYQVAMLPVPLALPALNYELYWHQRHHQDAAHQWLRQFLLGQPG